jgi:hypothetical protein
MGIPRNDDSTALICLDSAGITASNAIQLRGPSTVIDDLDQYNWVAEPHLAEIEERLETCDESIAQLEIAGFTLIETSSSTQDLCSIMVEPSI